MPSPYLDKSATHFWKTGVAEVQSSSVSPVPLRKFSIAHDAVVATAGSCFAQEVGKYLATMEGVSLLTAEPVASDQPLFSALYGNIYTARQMVQLFDRAFGRFEPLDSAWRREDGRYVDPFRPYIFSAGFENEDQVASARQVHLDAVRRVFTESSILVFTLGLTESWNSKKDGAVFPVAPGVVSNDIDPSAYEFHNFTYSEVLSDLRDLFHRLRSVNLGARVILTVSPVPLTATYTDEHVLVATTHSKSILRAVSSEIETEFDFVFYFPSYEIITGAFNRGQYYEDNLRTVTRNGVAHVMATFQQTYFGTAQDAMAKREVAAPAFAEDAVICDEEEIARSVGFD